MKKHIKTRSAVTAALAVGLCAAVAFSFMGFDSRCGDIRSRVLRLHVLANSDSDSDQSLKLSVRDALLENCGYIFESAQDETQAALAARENISVLKQTAAREISRLGYSYPVDVSVEPCYFETRTYGDVTMPAGVYESVRVTIGRGEGHNWWCVMFPPMCLPAAEGDVAADSKELEDVLTEEEIDIVRNAPKYELRFKSVEIIEGIKRWFASLSE